MKYGFFALGIALGLRPRAIPRVKTIFHGMSLLSSTYCYMMMLQIYYDLK